MTEDEMVGWHHRHDGHESEQALGVGDGQGSLACCSPWGRKESDTTEELKNTADLERPMFQGKVSVFTRHGPLRTPRDRLDLSVLADQNSCVLAGLYSAS